MKPPEPKPKPAADPVQRFAAGISACAGDESMAKDRFGVAVSGGGDSMALLWLAHQRFGERCHAATVDHQLRPEAADEAAMVATWCAAQKIDHCILTPATPIAGSLQSAARDTRYALLDDWRKRAKLDWILTAHHADDQLETFLMRLNRSSGVGGLAAIRAKNDVVLRPLLDWTHAELLALCDEKQLPHCFDPSNRDDRFDRVRIRKALANVDWLDPQAASASARALNDADFALDWSVCRLIASWPDHADPQIVRVAGYPAEIQRRVLGLRLAALDPGLPVRGDAMTRLIADMTRGKATMIGEWRIVPVRGVAQPHWRIVRAPPRKASRRG